VNVSVAMRTADRSPKRNYLRKTLDSYARSGGDVSRLHVCATAPDVDWMTVERGDHRPIVHVPIVKRGANENGLAGIEAALQDDAEMVCLLEDDITFCADFPGSLSRWLDRAVRPGRHVYRVFGFTTPPFRKPDFYDCKLESLRASQTLILGRKDAESFVAWGRLHQADLPPLAPWGRRNAYALDPTIAFDKFVATWALLTWPNVPGVISRPYFVRHIGDESTLHKYGLRNDPGFAGDRWSYRPQAVGVAL
jgi:hypothetical protein